MIDKLQSAGNLIVMTYCVELVLKFCFAILLCYAKAGPYLLARYKYNLETLKKQSQLSI